MLNSEKEQEEIAKFDKAMKERGYTYEVIECVGCPRNDTCELAWDLYNTDGDCLDLK